MCFVIDLLVNLSCQNNKTRVTLYSFWLNNKCFYFASLVSHWLKTIRGNSYHRIIEAARDTNGISRSNFVRWKRNRERERER